MRVRVVITGKVQKVCFRDFVARNAQELQLTGWVRNTTEGSVEALFCGAKADVQAMIVRCHEGPPAADVDSVHKYEEEGDVPQNFIINTEEYLQ
jgi:acylphosphatase